MDESLLCLGETCLGWVTGEVKAQAVESEWVRDSMDHMGAHCGLGQDTLLALQFYLLRLRDGSSASLGRSKG